MDEDESDRRLAANATFGVVALTALFWAWLFYEGLFSALFHSQKIAMALLIPIVGILLSVVMPLWLERIRKPRFALAFASLTLVGMLYLLVDMFLHAGI